MPPSRSGFHAPRRAGFTLKELVAIIFALCILLALVFPWIARSLNDKSIIPLLQVGSYLSKELLAKKLAGMPVEEVYPMTPNNGGVQYASSTDYFHHLIRDEVLWCDYSFFGGMGARPVKTKEAGRFTAANNAWSVVVDAPASKSEQAPFLLSRNLVLPDNRLPVGEAIHLQSLIENTTDQQLAFSKTHQIIITVSGSGNALYKAKDLGPGKAHLLNPTGKPLRVLRP